MSPNLMSHKNDDGEELNHVVPFILYLKRIKKRYLESTKMGLHNGFNL